jgi:hypothetical protein
MFLLQVPTFFIPKQDSETLSTDHVDWSASELDRIRYQREHISPRQLQHRLLAPRAEAPQEFAGLGNSLTRSRRALAEDGPVHQTARRLGALFESIVPTVLPSSAHTAHASRKYRKALEKILRRRDTASSRSVLVLMARRFGLLRPREDRPHRSTY